MIYKIDDKFYVKVGKDFAEVEMVYSDNDISLKPTSNRLENSSNLKYEEIHFLSNKDKFISDHKKSMVKKDEEVEVKPSFSYNKKSKYSK